MWLSKSGLAIIVGTVFLTNCADTVKDGPDQKPAVESAPSAQLLGGGIVTPLHEGQAGSPHVRVDWDNDGANLSISYGRPFLKGRTVGESVEPIADRVWRMGADEATTLTTDRDLMLGDAQVPAGEYTLWAISTGGTINLIVNQETGQWGTSYNQSRDLGRTAMTVGALDPPAEQLTFHIQNSELRFEWGSTVASVPILVH